MQNKTFENYVSDILTTTDRLCIERYQVGLTTRYGAPQQTVSIMEAIAKVGKTAFSLICGLMSKKSHMAFAVALTAFLISPVGALVLAALTYFGGRDSIMLLYDNRRMVLNCRTIFDKYYPQFEKCASPAEYDSIITDASKDLLAIS